MRWIILSVLALALAPAMVACGGSGEDVTDMTLAELEECAEDEACVERVQECLQDEACYDRFVQNAFGQAMLEAFSETGDELAEETTTETTAGESDDVANLEARVENVLYSAQEALAEAGASGNIDPSKWMREDAADAMFALDDAMADGALDEFEVEEATENVEVLSDLLDGCRRAVGEAEHRACLHGNTSG